MKTHTDAARTLALAALLGGARAGAAGGACDYHNTPEITANARPDYDGDFVSYGEDIVVKCSAKDTVHLSIEENSKYLQIMEVNTTTVELCVKKPNLGRYTYRCVDGGTGCEGSVTVYVTPAVSIESPKVYYRPYNEYFVPLGEDFEVFCSHDSEALGIALCVGDKRLQTDVMNSTLIKYRTKADRVERMPYICSANVTTTCVHLDHHNRVMNAAHLGLIMVGVDYYPECHSFGCVLYQYRVLECSWNYSSKIIISYQLFYRFTDPTEGYLYTPLCRDISGNVATGACKVDVDLTGRTLRVFHSSNVSLLLMSCNPYLCNNQSISVNIDAISKPESVHDFAVLNASAHGVALTWKYFQGFNLAHKIEYRQIKLDDYWRVGDLSSLRCDDYGCEGRLALPYPNTEYEVRVYHRHETATDDRLWSDPKTILVTTKPREQDCAYSSAPDTPTDPLTSITAETASREACTLREGTIKQSLALINKLRSMKEKI